MSARIRAAEDYDAASGKENYVGSLSIIPCDTCDHLDGMRFKIADAPVLSL